MATFTKLDAVDPSSIGMVKVVIHEAKQLKAADPNGFSDPYCVLISGTNQVKTSVKNKTLEPVWNESFDIDFTTNKFLILTVWDKDLITSDDFLGQIVVDLTQVPLTGTSVWRTLQPRQGKSDTGISGVIRLSLTSLGEAKIPAKAGSLSGEVKTRVMQAQRGNSTILDLSGCNLVELPPEAATHAEWVTLDLGFNKFQVWPETLASFGKLTELFLSGNQLKTLSPTVGNLTQLLRLYINGNQLEQLPEEIGNLVALEKFDVSNNKLKRLPASVGKLKKLEELNLSGNVIAEGLPVEIGELDYLIVMNLNACGLAELPKEFCNLDRLLELDLGTNSLTRLPSDFGSLTRLVQLNLSDNQLTDLPMSMGRCIRLDSCFLERNPINNEELMRKYRVGTDHLVDYLEKRLFAFEQEQKRRQREAAKRAGGARPKIPRPGIPRDGQDTPSDAVDDKPTVSPAVNPDDLLPLEERLKKKKYNGQLAANVVRQDLIELKKGLMVAKTIEETVPISKAIRDLKFMDDARTCILPVERLKPPPLFPHETKFQQLKKVTMVSLKEVETVLSAATNTLITNIRPDQVDTLCRVVEQSKQRIAEAHVEMKAAAEAVKRAAIAKATSDSGLPVDDLSDLV